MYVLPCFPAAQTGFLFLENYSSDKVCILVWDVGGVCLFGLVGVFVFFNPSPLSLMKSFPFSLLLTVSLTSLSLATIKSFWFSPPLGFF